METIVRGGRSPKWTKIDERMTRYWAACQPAEDSFAAEAFDRCLKELERKMPLTSGHIQPSENVVRTSTRGIKGAP